LTLLAAPIVAATVATALMWCVHQWNWPLGVVATVGGTLFLGSMAIAWRFNRRMVERRFRFRIREMLVGVAVISLLIGTLGRWWFIFHRDWLSVPWRGSYGCRGSSEIRLERWTGARRPCGADWCESL
jgi:hypothetical protein